jgi:hypothetical protein
MVLRPNRPVHLGGVISDRAHIGPGVKDCVLAHIEASEYACALPIFRQHEGGPGRFFWLVKLGRPAVEPDLAFLDSAEAVNGLAELRAPGTNNTGKPDDLTRVHGERNVSQKLTRPERLDLQYLPIHPRVGRHGFSRMPSCVHDQRAFVPKHPANDGIDVGLADFGRADAGAIA